MFYPRKTDYCGVAAKAAVESMRARSVAAPAIARASELFTRLTAACDEERFATYDQDMAELATIARVHADIRHHFIGAVPFREKFTDLLNQTDPSRPKFNTGVAPETLFPMELFSRAASGTGLAVSGCMEERLVAMDLMGIGKNLAGMDISAANRLPASSEWIFKDTPVRTDDCVFEARDPDDYTNDKGTIYNLKWMANITNFWITLRLRGNGLGSVLYLDNLEPYLKSCGFDTVAVNGACYDNPGTTHFWRMMGFSERIQTYRDADPPTRPEYHYVSFKTI